MTIEKPCRIQVKTIVRDAVHDHSYPCVVTATVKSWEDKYELKLYIADKEQLHLSFYLAFNTLNIVSNEWHIDPPAGKSRLLFQVLLPQGMTPGKINARWTSYGICITIFKKQPVPHIEPAWVLADAKLLSPVQRPV